MSVSRLVSSLVSSGLERFVNVLTNNGFNDENVELLCVEDLRKLRITNKNLQQKLIACARNVKLRSCQTFEANMNPTAGDCCRQAQTFLEHHREDRLWPRPSSLLAKTIGFTNHLSEHCHGDQAAHCSTCASHGRSHEIEGAKVACKLPPHRCCQSQILGDHTTETILSARRSIIVAEEAAILSLERVCRSAIDRAETEAFLKLQQDFRRILFELRAGDLNRREAFGRLEIVLSAERNFGHLISELDLARALQDFALEKHRQVTAVTDAYVAQLVHDESASREDLYSAEANCASDFFAKAATLRSCWESFQSKMKKKSRRAGDDGIGLPSEPRCLKCHEADCEFFHRRWHAHWSHRPQSASGVAVGSTIGQLFDAARSEASKIPQKPPSPRKKVQRPVSVKSAATPAPPAAPFQRAPFRCGTLQSGDVH